MVHPLFLEEIDDEGIARIVLTRTEVHNAFDEILIAELTTVLKGLADDQRVRALVLSAQGKSFSAGADLNWMKRSADYAEAENLADAKALAELMSTLDRFPRPTLALVHGAAFGGGVGLVACCDIAIASTRAVFSLSEVKLGLIPAVISPYVIAAMGARAVRRYFLTAERFDSHDALRLGLVHEVVPHDELDAAGARVLTDLLTGGPEAQAEAKALIRNVAGAPIDAALIEQTSQHIAKVRAGAEAKAGIAAFLEKRKPDWMPEG